MPDREYAMRFCIAILVLHTKVFAGPISGRGNCCDVPIRRVHLHHSPSVETPPSRIRCLPNECYEKPARPSGFVSVCGEEGEGTGEDRSGSKCQDGEWGEQKSESRNRKGLVAGALGPAVCGDVSSDM